MSDVPATLVGPVMLVEPGSLVARAIITGTAGDAAAGAGTDRIGTEGIGAAATGRALTTGLATRGSWVGLQPVTRLTGIAESRVTTSMTCTTRTTPVLAV